MKKIHLLFISALFIVSCKPDARYAIIKGEWKGAAWLVDGKPSNKNVARVGFVFNQDNTFSSQFGSKQERGTYSINGENLLTQAENQLEIMTRISILTKD